MYQKPVAKKGMADRIKAKQQSGGCFGQTSIVQANARCEITAAGWSEIVFDNHSPAPIFPEQPARPD